MAQKKRRRVGAPCLPSTLWLVDTIQGGTRLLPVGGTVYWKWLALYKEHENYTPRDPARSFRKAIESALRILDKQT